MRTTYSLLSDTDRTAWSAAYNRYEKQGEQSYNNDVKNAYRTVQKNAAKTEQPQTQQYSALTNVLRQVVKMKTITNIIAEALADGKEVLFVSEKAAALEVVYKRLSEVGLGDFCLALHGHKANKKEILDSIAAQAGKDNRYLYFYALVVLYATFALGARPYRRQKRV